MGMIIINGRPYSGSSNNANNIKFTPPDGMSSNTVQEAIQENRGSIENYVIKREITTGQVEISANAGALVNFTPPTVEGYTYLTRVGKVNGSAAVIAQPDSTWLYNTASTSASVTVTYICIYVKNI